MHRCSLCERQLSDDEPFHVDRNGLITCFSCLHGADDNPGVRAFLAEVLDELEPDDTED